MSSPEQDNSSEAAPSGAIYNEHYKGLQVGSYTDQKLVR